MLTPTFAETHNLVTFLEKPAESAGFEQTINFLKYKPIHYALTVNPAIYVSYVKQFWATTKVKKVNDQEYIQALVDKKKVIITKDSIRSDLHFDDAEGSACLLNEAIFECLARMGVKTNDWNEFSSTMASAIIYLANNQKFNFSNLKEQVLNLQEAKDAQVNEITALKKKVSKLNKWRNSRSRGLRRLKKIGLGRIVKSPTEKDSLGAQEDASKQRRMIEEIDQNAEIALDDETQGRTNDWSWVAGVVVLEEFVGYREWSRLHGVGLWNLAGKLEKRNSSTKGVWPLKDYSAFAKFVLVVY
nr:hypothetical protein [Tanacetum cinerariifolium]